MSALKRPHNRPKQLGLVLTLITLALVGCGGKSSTTPATTAPPPKAAIKITPMKGQFGVGTSVKVKRANDNVEVGTCLVDASGSCSANIATTETGPFLIEAGIAGDTYFNEATGTSASVPANTTALRALIPNVTAAVGVTALTEMAVGQIEANTGGIAATKVTDVIAANATIGSQFGVPNPLVPPAVIGAGTATAKLNGGNEADDYALKLAALAKLTKAGKNPIQALHDLRDDIKDGKLDGKKGTVAITTFTVPVPTGTQNYQDAMNAELNNLLTVAATAYATPGTAVPTVTMTVADLAALLDVAMKVGAATQAASAGTAMTTETLNTQIANTVQTQVSTLAVTGATTGTIQAGSNAAVAAGSTAGGVLANGKTASNNFLAAAATGVFEANFQLNAAAGTSINFAQLRKMTMSFNGTNYDYAEVVHNYNSGTGWSQFGTNIAGYYWDLTATSTGGWVDTSIGKFGASVAADGTLTVANLSSNGSSIGDSFSLQIQQVDLSGKPVKGCYAKNNVGTQSLCTIAPFNTATYPAGSTGFRFYNQYRNVDMYSVDTSQGAAATNMNGVALTALPKLGDSFCSTNQGGSAVYVPIVGAAAGASNYSQKWIGQGGCTAANIATVAGQVGGQAMTLSTKDTGNAAAPQVLTYIQNNCNGCGNEVQIFAYIPSKGVFQGWFQARGASTNQGSNIMTNRIAFDAMVNAAKAVTGVTGLGAAVPTIP